MKKDYQNFSCVKKMLLSFAMLSLVMSGYAQRTVTLYPTADIQFRKDNTTQSGTGPSFEMRTSTAGSQDYAFVGGAKFDLTSTVAALGEDEEIDKVELRFTIAQASKDIVIYPFTNAFGEAGGSTDSWANYETDILAAVVETPVVADFRPTWTGSKKIFEWTDFATTTIANYQTTKDVTSYFVDKISASIPEYEIGLLFAPTTTTTVTADPTIIFTKDVSASSYGTGTTNGYNDDGTATGGSGDVTRWSRIEQLLRISGFEDDLTQLYPTLILTIEDDGGGTGIGATSINKEVVSKTYYDFSGRQVLEEAAKGILLQKSVYEDGSTSYEKIFVNN